VAVHLVSVADARSSTETRSLRFETRLKTGWVVTIERGVFRLEAFGGKVPDGRSTEMTSATGTGHRLGARTLGALAVAGVVVGFSLSATLAKQAQTPGVLIAFWRLTIASILWNLYLRSTGRRVTMRGLRQAVLPGVFIGLNLAVFFAGATNNSVANAALISSLSPFFILPIGAKLFREFNDSRAIVFALVGFGGVALVLLSAPAAGDATLKGNVFGFVAMLLLVAYVVSTRHFRRDMDVAAFMATVCPIGALVVLPITLANSDGLGMTSRGWTYTLILTLLSGVAASGLLVYAQKAIQIGTIAIAQVVQPAIAVVCSFVILGEALRFRQLIGIAVAIAGVAAFVVLNQHGERLHRGGSLGEPEFAGGGVVRGREEP
jgi:drug/metabolite transporter (DMT)-like permease